MLETRYPDIYVTIGDGNAFAIMGQVDRALRKAGVSKELRDSYRREATDGDYNNLLAVTMKWVNVRTLVSEWEDEL